VRVLPANEIGAGKTAEMVIGAMELRRLGMARKPWPTVPCWIESAEEETKR
jgi:N12 class adenine-specific DNA methylase